MFLQTYDVEDLARAVLEMSPFHPVECPIKADESFCATVVESDAFGEKTHTTAAGGMTKVLSEHATTAARGPHKAHSEMNRGTLARAVWSKEAENLSGLDGQAESVKGSQATLTAEATILFRYVLELKHCAHRRSFYLACRTNAAAFTTSFCRSRT